MGTRKQIERPLTGILKTCSKCKEDKDTSLFNKNSTAKDGLQRYCRQCNKSYGRNYYKENSDGIKVQRKTAAEERKLIEELEAIKQAKEQGQDGVDPTGDSTEES